MATSPEQPEPKSSKPLKARRALGRLTTLGGRGLMWALLDHLDARPALKKALLVGVPALALTLGVAIWGYEYWARSNAIRIARQWLDADRLDRANAAVQNAIMAEPEIADTWQLASELAWKKGNREASVNYAKKAADVSRYQPQYVLAWAEASVLTNDLEQANEALGFMDAGAAGENPRALRLAGEILRRGRQFPEARDKFEAALQRDIASGSQSLATDEVPLGIVSLQTAVVSDRARGRLLLEKWATDRDWGVEAVRALVADAEAHGEREAAARWADSLLSNPCCTLGDIPAYLRALADYDIGRYEAALAPLEERCRSNPTAVAQLLGWLTEIGRGSEAVRWARSLDPATIHQPPIAPAVSEALRATQNWSELQVWVDQGDWGRDLEFMGWAYGMIAARHLGDHARADSLWRSVLDDGRAVPAHALFMGDSLVAWGYPKDAETLLWAAAERPDLAFQALGSLARLYQLEHDAAGQYRAFSRLNAMRPADRRIANNLAYFAAVTDLGSQALIRRIAEDNFTHEPGNVYYRSTYALVLVWSGEASRAMSVLEPVSRNWKDTPAVAFAYGATLAGLGRKSEAKEVFDSLKPGDLGPQEIEWIRSTLR